MSSFDFASPGVGDTVEAIVKWFNPAKGFGFVAPVDGSSDAFMHMSVLSRAGLQHIDEGVKLLVEIGDGQKGRQVLRIVQVLGAAEGGRETGSGSSRPAPTGPAEEMVGTVKWFKNDKGFGFVTPDDGGKDVFVHRSVVMRAGLAELVSGQKLRMQVHTADKGREASEISAI
ncbi:MAG: cold shock domain-containing protein [Alphaproteobacteria bacterium]|nr:cold shock domain-containing protein [Alphaproteobacteria bacterium]